MKCDKGKVIHMPKHMKVDSLTCCSTLHKTWWPFWRSKHAADDVFSSNRYIYKKELHWVVYCILLTWITLMEWP